MPVLNRRAIWVLGSLVVFLSFSQGMQTIRDRIQHRMEARKRSVHAGSDFPNKGRLDTAEKRVIRFDGLDRDYLIQPVREPGPHPVTVLLHGGTQTAESVWTETSLPTLGERDKFIVVAPDAINKHWNDGRGATFSGSPSTADDVGFLKQVISSVIARDQGNANAIFMVGASNGGFMTMRFACEAGEMLRAAGNVISTLPLEQQKSCPAKKPLPWISMNGTDDPIVPFKGEAAGTMKNGQAQPALLSADETFAFWADRDGCNKQIKSMNIRHLDRNDETSAELRRRENCAGGSSSLYYIFQGAGHIWSNSQPGTLVKRVVGESNQDVDAGDAIWKHFRSTLQQ